MASSDSIQHDNAELVSYSKDMLFQHTMPGRHFLKIDML